MIKIGKILFEIFEKMLGGDLLFVSSVYTNSVIGKIYVFYSLHILQKLVPSNTFLK